jgi:hypothetical protein
MDEWDRLPWFEQKLLSEGLVNESPWIGRVAMMEKASDPLDTRAGVFSDPIDEDDNFEGSADDLSSFGIQVRKKEKMTPVYKAIGS